MVKKPTLILLNILIALGVFAWWFEFSPASEERKATPTIIEVPGPLADWKLEDTVIISYNDPERTPITLRMGANFGEWSIAQAPGIPADAGRVLQVFAELAAIKPVTKLETDINVAAMGLADSAKVLTLEDTKGTTKVIRFGNETATKSGTYLKAGDDYFIINTPVLKNLDALLSIDGIISPTPYPTLPARPQ